MRPWIAGLLLLLAGCMGPQQQPATTTTTTSDADGPNTTPPPFTSGPPSGSAFELFEDFEGGLGNWTQDSDVPQDPNRPGSPVAWNITLGDNGWEDHQHVAEHPMHSARFHLDGRQADGTIWLERQVRLEGGRAYVVDVSFAAWSATNSSNTLAYVVAYAGLSDPEREDDFPDTGMTVESGARGGIRHTLNQQEGWLPYRFEWTTPVLQDGTFWVAVGLSVVWPTEVTYDVDAIRVTARPCQSCASTPAPASATP